MLAQGGRRVKQRFSFLLLEEGDSYIHDWLATCRFLSLNAQPDAQQVKGRLRLCARSIFFEPHDVSTPIFMFPFRKVRQLVQSSSPDGKSARSQGSRSGRSRWDGEQEGLLLETSLCVKMKENGADAPYVFDKRDTRWWFTLDYAPLHQLMQQLQPLLAIRELPRGEQEAALRQLVAGQEACATFDTSRLVDLGEHVRLDCPAAQVTPLVREPGRLVLTQARLYFQPLHNVGEDRPVRCVPLRHIVAVARRRHSLRPLGVELFLAPEEEEAFGRSGSAGALGDGRSALFALRTEGEREAVVAHLQQLLGGQSGAAGALLEARGPALQRITGAWQRGEVSNYEYLLFLNLAAGRSFNDLTQWPVMPWVLADYSSAGLDLASPATFRDLSKPVGALNPSRLALLRERYQQLADDPGGQAPFLYGTHYSTPGYVLFWLVRAAPAHMLRLQNGRFDAPDRLFASIRDAWQSVLTNAADVKELIPEFFAPPSDFLVMPEGLSLGARQRGDHVSDVALPPWAADPDDFIAKHAAALESEGVASQLHRWIDLIFGCKQRGEAALAADNLFHPLTYEGAVDLEAVSDPVERLGLEAQAGQASPSAPKSLLPGGRAAWPASSRLLCHCTQLHESPDAPLCLGRGGRVVCRSMSLARPRSSCSQSLTRPALGHPEGDPLHGLRQGEGAAAAAAAVAGGAVRLQRCWHASSRCPPWEGPVPSHSRGKACGKKGPGWRRGREGLSASRPPSRLLPPRGAPPGHPLQSSRRAGAAAGSQQGRGGGAGRERQLRSPPPALHGPLQPPPPDPWIHPQRARLQRAPPSPCAPVQPQRAVPAHGSPSLWLPPWQLARQNLGRGALAELALPLPKAPLVLLSDCLLQQQQQQALGGGTRPACCDELWMEASCRATRV